MYIEKRKAVVLVHYLPGFTGADDALKYQAIYVGTITAKHFQDKR